MSGGGKSSWSESVLEFAPHEHEFAMGAPSQASLEWPTAVSARVAAALHDGRLRSLTEFNLFEFDDDELVQLALEMLLQAGAAAALSTDVGTLQRLLLRIRRAYRLVPFHNFKHAFNVMQAAFAFLEFGQCGALLTPLERVTLLLASLGHDIDHPGYANVFQKLACTRLAVRYNDTSVLESHHAASFFAVLARADCDVFRHLPRADFLQFRAAAIELILATDLAQHKPYIDRIAALDLSLLTAASSNTADATAAAAARRTLMCGLIKCADLCNEIRTFALSQRWVPLVLTEFFMQGDTEKQRGYPVGFTNDRDKVTAAGSQIGFIKFLCLPLYDTMVRVAPALQLALDNLRANLAHWEAEQAAPKKQ